MLVQVKYRNGTFGRVKSEDLEELIHQGEIIQFLRSDGWAKVPGGCLRLRRSGICCIPDRRATLAYRHLLESLDS